MSMWSRVRNVFHSDRVSREIEEELAAHAEETGRPFTGMLRYTEQSRDVKLLPWLDSLRADAVFGWRQLRKNWVVSSSAIFSLALTIGATTAAFRLIDALLLRPLPVVEPERLYYIANPYLGRDGKIGEHTGFSYPHFLDFTKAASDKADVIAIGFSSRIDITYGTPQEMERAYRQWVSGAIFANFGLQPALGRLLTPSDDQKGAHPVAVISYDYWTRRFGRDLRVLGRTVKIADKPYEIVGVLQPGFTGTDTGLMTDLYVPTMMSEPWTIEQATVTWLRMGPAEARRHGGAGS